MLNCPLLFESPKRQNNKSFSTKTIWPWIKDEFLRFGQKQNFNESVLNEFKRLKYDNDALSREEEIRKIFDRQVKARILDLYF